jgi:serine/threonine protein kinase
MTGPRVIAGRYVLLSELGRGGMGVVWRAEDRVIGRHVALKELPIPPGHDQALFQERVLREARTAGRLNDPAVVTVFDVSFERGFAYLVMELVEAPTLADLIAAGSIGEARVVEIARQVLGALKTAHDAGIVHRDVKPSNIMVLPGDRAKLADFGIARGIDDPSLTATGGIMGSPGYMAPELFAGSPPAPATDLWSLGATLFHAVEGQAPFTRTTTAATMHAILTERPRPARCGEPLATLLAGLLTQSPEDRLTGPAAMALLGAAPNSDATVAVAPQADGVTQVVAGPTAMVSAPPRSTRPNVMEPTVVPWNAEAPADDPWADDRPRRARPPLLLVGAGALVVAAMVAVFFFIPGSGTDEPRPTAVAVANDQQDAGPASPTESSASVPSSATPQSSGAPASTATSVPSATPSSAGAPASATSAPGKTSAAPVQPQPSTDPKPTSTTVAPPTWTRTTITRYSHPTEGWHMTATARYPAPSGWRREAAMGDLSADSAPGTLKLYSCQQGGSQDRLTSTDQSGNCEGHERIGLLGYIFKDQPGGAQSIALYRCLADGVHFDSLDPKCEGKTTEARLGYLLAL